MNESPHVQFGRFNLLDDSYNGPYGIGPDADDGINWLDYKFFNINTALSTNNLNPLPRRTWAVTRSRFVWANRILGLRISRARASTVEVDVTPSLTGAGSIDGLNASDGETAR